MISKRVETIQTAYAELGQLADKRQTLLQDAIRLFQFNRECNDFEVWMREKEKFLKAEDPTLTVEAAKHAFEVRLWSGDSVTCGVGLLVLLKVSTSVQCRICFWMIIMSW